MLIRRTLLWVAAGIAAALRPECPVQLLSVEEDGHAFQLQKEGLSYLQRQRSPLYLVPVMGVYRSGKSFTLNRCMGLQAPYASGFGVGHTQDTHTRGIYICAEVVEGLGTVVWMDTEGLFSSEYAQSTYGPKIFSLSVLFSSTVLLNSVKVLNDQFFGFFSEQQQVARVLRHGLVGECLPEGTLLPRNHSLIWILQQPVGTPGPANVQLKTQLDGFLTAPGDEARERVHRDFSHHMHAVPAASHDVRSWGGLDAMSEGELRPDFVDATASLRELVLSQLRYSRPFEADGVAEQMQMFAKLVDTAQFDGKLARKAVEESELSTRCGDFRRSLTDLTEGELPIKGLVTAIQEMRLQAESKATEAVENFHFTQGWKSRLNSCLDARAVEIVQDNDQRLLDLWQRKASQMAENGGCFFLDELVALRGELEKAHDCVLNEELQSRSVKFATSLQRTRLVECMKLKHLLVPFLPWLSWPIISSYIRTGLFSGLWQLGVHSFLVTGAYSILRMFGQLPAYIDLEFALLQAQPQLLDAVMEVMPWIPWVRLTTVFTVMGACWSFMKLARAIADAWRPAGDQIGGMVNLELKLNSLLKRSEALMQQGIMATLQEVNAHASHRDSSSARLALLRGLSMLRGTSGEDPQLSAMADMPLRRRILHLLEDCSTEAEASGGFCEAWASRDILGTALRGDWAVTVRMMVEVLEKCRASTSSEFGVALDVRTRCAPGRERVRSPRPLGRAGITGLQKRDNFGGS